MSKQVTHTISVLFCCKLGLKGLKFRNRPSNTLNACSYYSRDWTIPVHIKMMVKPTKTRIQIQYELFLVSSGFCF